MSRYIDADKLLETIKQHNYRLRNICNTVDYGMYTVGIEQAIAEQPTVEAKPIKHGHWIVEKRYDNGRCDYACSCCAFDDTIYYEVLLSYYYYCPNCGAKMDEVEE